MYSAWQVVVLVTFALLVAGWTGFLIGREWRAREPREYDATNARAPRPVTIMPEIRAELRRRGSPKEGR